MNVAKLLILTMALLFVTNSEINAQESAPASKVTKLTVLWYSGDPMVAERVALMYTGVAKKYKLFEEVSVIIWGPSAKLVAENAEIQAKVKEMMGDGVTVSACVTCANLYGVTDQLKALGITVDIMGMPLTNALKAEDTRVLSF